MPVGKLTILAGAAGTGKTTLALALAVVLTAGGRWPDGSQCKQPGNVLIWSSEDVADDTLVPRLIASGADLSRCHFIDGIAQDGESVPLDPSQDIADPADASGAGYAWRTIERAKRDLGIQAAKAGIWDGGQWILPKTAKE